MRSLVFRYLPALDEARALRADLEAMVGRVQESGLGIDQATADALDTDLASARSRLGHLQDLLAGDPLIRLARALPPTASNVRGADSVVAAAGDLLDAVGQGMTLAHRFITIRESQAADPQKGSALSQLVELMATSRDDAVSAAASVASARQALAAVPDGLIGQVETMRDAMLTRIDKYGPLLDTYVQVSARLPAILGWDGPRRYLVLTQDPAELRPSGGFIGSYGIIAFDKGRITERRFLSVSPLDGKNDYPFVRPPQELADYLLGPTQSWQLADAGWSPDFPTSAQDALRLYTNESGDAQIDGVLGITTYTIDELLKVTGPITRPRLQRHDRVRRDDPEGPPADPGHRGSRARTEGLSVGVRGSPPRHAPRPATCALGRHPRGGRDVRAGAPPPRLVPRSDGRGVRRGRWLRRRGQAGRGRLRLPGRFERRAANEAERVDDHGRWISPCRSTPSATRGTRWT